MTERICISNGECRQYCDALNALTDTPPSPTDCPWPSDAETLIATKPVDERAAIATVVARKLMNVLDTEASLESNPNMQQALIAADVHRDMHESQKSKWQYIVDCVSQNGRTPTDAELVYFSDKIYQTRLLSSHKLKELELPSRTLGQAIFDKETLDKEGLLYDDDVTETMDRVLDNVIHGRPTLLVGEKGLAKTKMAQAVAAMFYPDGTPIVISGHGSMMTDELVGRVEIRNGNTVFEPGKLIEAMEKGLPVVLDELNLTDQQTMMRMQDMLLKRPGESFVLQEDGRTVTIQPGFAVIATANEASRRYKNREQLDPAFRDRFEVIRVDYPDIGTKHITDYPRTNIRLALAHTITESGAQNEHVDAYQAVELARLAHATQRLYALPAEDTALNLVGSTADIVDATVPMMSDCITPRKMVKTLQKIATGTLNGATVKTEIERLLSELDQNGSANKGMALKLRGMIEKSRDPA